MTVVNYRQELKPEKFQYISKELDSRYPIDVPDQYRDAVILHGMCVDEMDYLDSGRYINPPGKMVGDRSGDCQDQTVALSSMMVAAGLDIYIVSVGNKNQGAGHVFPMVRLPDAEHVPISDKLKAAYRDIIGQKPRGIKSMKAKGGRYYFADPTHSSFIGDMRSLKRKFIVETSNGWEFYDKRREYFVSGR